MAAMVDATIAQMDNSPAASIDDEGNGRTGTVFDAIEAAMPASSAGSGALRCDFRMSSISLSLTSLLPRPRGRIPIGLIVREASRRLDGLFVSPTRRSTKSHERLPRATCRKSLAGQSLRADFREESRAGHRDPRLRFRDGPRKVPATVPPDVRGFPRGWPCGNDRPGCVGRSRRARVEPALQDGRCGGFRE